MACAAVCGKNQNAGLRAHILRAYNYMAAGVGLTALAVMLTYRLTGPEVLQTPLVWVFIPWCSLLVPA